MMTTAIPKDITETDYLTSQYKADLSLQGARGAWKGADFINSLKDKREVWYDGEKIDVTTHPSFTGLLKNLAGLYDLQYRDGFSQKMLWQSERTGNPVSYSYLAPENHADLEKKWTNSHIWTEQSYGQLTRIPDFMANVIVGLYDFRKQLGKVDLQFERNAERYYHYCREHDICVTHALGDPQIDRSSSPVEHPDYALRVIERRDDGIVVKGAKQLATLAPYSHEALIYLSPAFYAREKPEYVAWFSLPMDTQGLKLLCRESHSEITNQFRHSFSANYDEQDCIMFFDNVFIPMNRVFLLQDTEVAAKGFHEINKWSLYVGHIRFYHRLRTFLGVASLVAKSIGVSEYREILSLLGELTSFVEIIRVGLVGMNSEAKQSPSGLMAPNSTLAFDAFASRISSRITDILKIIGGSGIVMQPSERDLKSAELMPFLKTYMIGKDVDVDFKSALFRLAFELVGDRFGLRQELYEMWNRGDVVRTHMALYRTYPDLEKCEDRIRDLINR